MSGASPRFLLFKKAVDFGSTPFDLATFERIIAGQMVATCCHVSLPSCARQSKRLLSFQQGPDWELALFVGFSGLALQSNLQQETLASKGSQSGTGWRFLGIKFRVIFAK